MKSLLDNVCIPVEPKNSEPNMNNKHLPKRLNSSFVDPCNIKINTHQTDKDAATDNYQPKTALGRKLIALRRAYVEKGGSLLDAEGLDAELMTRRGGIDNA